MSTVIILIGLLAALGGLWLNQRDASEPISVSSIATDAEKDAEKEEAIQEIEANLNQNLEEQAPSLPNSVLLAVPFISQAPHANWDLPYQEACEEASIIMLQEALAKTDSLSIAEADDRIHALVEFQTQTFGSYKDTDANETAKFATDYYRETYTVENNVTLDDLRQWLAEGRAIAAPMAGRLLGNPNFTPPGPLYHMLVLRGYDDATQEFITNDPGTRHGELYRYSYDTLMHALHDFPGSKETIEQGGKNIIMINPLPR